MAWSQKFRLNAGKQATSSCERKIRLLSASAHRYRIQLILLRRFTGESAPAKILAGQNQFFYLKKASFKCLATTKLKFLDIKNYIAPGFDCAQFIGACEMEQQDFYGHVSRSKISSRCTSQRCHHTRRFTAPWRRRMSAKKPTLYAGRFGKIKIGPPYEIILSRLLQQSGHWTVFASCWEIIQCKQGAWFGRFQKQPDSTRFDTPHHVLRPAVGGYFTFINQSNSDHHQVIKKMYVACWASYITVTIRSVSRTFVIASLAKTQSCANGPLGMMQTHYISEHWSVPCRPGTLFATYRRTSNHPSTSERIACGTVVGMGGSWQVCSNILHAQWRLTLPDVLERQGPSLNLLPKVVMSLILEKNLAVLEYFPAFLKILE